MVAEKLGIGEKQAKKSRQLCNELGIDDRTLRRIVAAERKAGAPICRCNNGIFLAQNIHEIFDTRNYFFERYKAARENLKIFDELYYSWKDKEQELRQFNVFDYGVKNELEP